MESSTCFLSPTGSHWEEGQGQESGSGDEHESTAEAAQAPR
ncbi:hypothetical protein E2C01_079085 [Portunus trituberculatus]|uniref:Uncharacterized protein n=1 Tax=Portunus trituberculatus TaxID=210409 RepID=A0A5B7IQI0_PORTR|nr:hypothetical protein [Portunus trituberculatus]